MRHLRDTYWRAMLFWAAVSGLGIEGITVYLRFGQGQTAMEFNQTAPLLLQIHHLFWSGPIFLAALAVSSQRIRSALWGIGFGLIVSDLAHHFLVLPLTVGNTGWHWP